MQFESGVAADLIQIIQALVVIVVAAPTIIRGFFHIRQPTSEVETPTTLSAGWTG